MDITTVQKLFRSLDRSESEEAVKTIVAAPTNPDAARSLWHLLFSSNTTDDRFRTALEWVLESVLVDYITNHMNSNDDYAITIGRRLTTILEAIGRSESEEHAKTA